MKCSCRITPEVTLNPQNMGTGSQITGNTSSNQDDSRQSDSHQGNARGPWTPDEEEAISILMDLLPMLAAANEAAKRRRHRKNDPL